MLCPLHPENMSQKMSTAELTVDEFERFRDFFYRKTGIFFENNKRYFVDRRILQRIEDTKNETFRQYFMFMRLQASQQEFQQLVNSMTVNETYFFREESVSYTHLTLPTSDLV